MEISDKNKQKWTFSADFFTLEYRTSHFALISHFSAKTFRPQNSPYFLCKPRTRNSRANGLKQNEWSFPLVWSRGGLGGGGE